MRNVYDWLILGWFVAVGALCLVGCSSVADLDPVAQRIAAINHGQTMSSADYAEVMRETLRSAKKDTVVITRVDTIYRDTCSPVAKKSIVP